MDHVDEFRRSKNGGKELWGGLKWPENGRKINKISVTHGAAAVGFVGQIPARPAAVGREILRPASSGSGAPRGLARVQ